MKTNIFIAFILSILISLSQGCTEKGNGNQLSNKSNLAIDTNSNQNDKMNNQPNISITSITIRPSDWKDRNADDMWYKTNVKIPQSDVCIIYYSKNNINFRPLPDKKVLSSNLDELYWNWNINDLSITLHFYSYMDNLNDPTIPFYFRIYQIHALTK